METKKDRQEKKLAKRKKAVYNMFKKYPDGFTMRSILEEHPKLFTHKLQARNVMNVLRKEDSTVVFQRSGVDCRYLQRVDTYKLLNQLWRVQ